ncbi:MAG: radical SAM protein [Gammaproteobacteria bacterium]|nr:radical SAM protein [Gammaproteobacteria bacterium]
MSTTGSTGIPRTLLSHFAYTGTAHTEETLFGSDNPMDPQTFADALARSGLRTDAPRALYVHLPFCPVRCLNCEQNAVITHDAAKIDRYLAGLEQEARMTLHTLGYRPRLQRLHLGGGSPNYLNERQLVGLMAIIDEHFIIDDETDASLDANPRRCSPSQLALLRGLGFDRIYFGLRELDPAVQLAIGRTTSIAMLRDVFDTARDVGFATLGTDVQYGLPCQTGDGVKRTIDSLLSLSPDRITCSAFTRRTANQAHQNALDHCTLPSLADKMVLFNTIVKGLADAYAWIGLDNFAKHGDELTLAQQEHRLHKSWLGYSSLPSGDVLGLGTNAISDLDEICVQNHVDVRPWQQSVDAGQFPVRGGFRLTSRQRTQRDAIRALLCNLELHDYSDLFADDDEESTWNGYADQGLVAITQDTLRVTDEGRYFLPHLLAH